MFPGFLKLCFRLSNKEISMSIQPEEVLERGLRLLGVTPEERNRRKYWTNELDFVAHFGPSPDVVAALWTNLCTTQVAAAKIDPRKHRLKDFLVALHWLKVYPTERERKIAIKVGKNSGRKWSWLYVRKIAALKDEVIKWPEKWETIFTVSVDGVHFRLKEPTSKEYKFLPEYFSHKHGSARLDYEIAINIFMGQVVRIVGPFPAGRGDLDIFQEEGLMDLIPHGHKVIADRGYHGLYEIISTPNPCDDEDVARFKSLALARHETFNGRLKRFCCLRETFRGNGIKVDGEKLTHLEAHGIVFDAVAVICQLELMLDSPLFDV
jgi:hypothetical protein